jgi:hypothetical protein
MSRPPDISHAGVKGGYDQERGPYIEAQWTWEWTNQDTPPETTPAKDDSPRNDTPSQERPSNSTN